MRQSSSKLIPTILANIPVITPAPLSFGIAIPITYILSPLVSQLSLGRFDVCDFNAGGGSINLCSNDTFLWSVFISILLSTAISVILTQLIMKFLQINWLHSIIGIIIFYGGSTIILFLHAFFTHGIYGNDLGELNKILVPSLLLVSVVFALIVCGCNSFFFYRKVSPKLS